MRILILGHGCSPRAGSEPGGTWNLAWQLSLLHEVFVLAYPHDRDGIERFLRRYPNESLRFFWLDLPGSQVARQLDSGVQSPSLYLFWQTLAYKKAIELHKRIGFAASANGSARRQTLSGFGYPFELRFRRSRFPAQRKNLYAPLGWTHAAAESFALGARGSRTGG